MIEFGNPDFQGYLSPCVMVTLMSYNLWPYGVPLVTSYPDHVKRESLGFVMHDDAHRISRQTYAQQRLFSQMIGVLQDANAFSYYSLCTWNGLMDGYHESKQRSL